MAEVNILAQITPTTIDTITVDAALTELHTMQNTVTRHPVEKGAAIVDHVRPEPDGLQLDCLVSDTPLSKEQFQRAVAFGAKPLSTDPDQIAAVPGYAKLVYDRLKLLRDTGALLVVATSLRTYGLTSDDQLVIENISIPRAAETKNSLRFSIQLVAIRIVQNQFTRVVTAKSPSVQPEVKTGNQVPKPDPVNRSRLKAMKLSAQNGKGALGKLGNVTEALITGETIK